MVSAYLNNLLTQRGAAQEPISVSVLVLSYLYSTNLASEHSLSAALFACPALDTHPVFALCTLFVFLVIYILRFVFQKK